MQAVLVSFLVPAYNVAQHIEETLGSVLADPRDDIELLIVDDGSTDGTAAILNSLADTRVRIISQSNSGLPATRNTGIRNSSGKYIVFLDGDDIFNMATLDELVEPMEKDTSIVLSYAAYRRFSYKLPPTSKVDLLFWPRPSGALLKSILQRNFIGALGACCIRREALDLVGPFNERLRMGEDWEMYARLAGVGNFHYVPGCVALFYRQHPLSMSAVLGGSAQNYTTFSEAVFAGTAVKAMFSETEIGRLQRSQRAHIQAYIALRALEVGAWRKAGAGLIEAMITYPPRSLEFFARLAWNALRVMRQDRSVEPRK